MDFELYLLINQSSNLGGALLRLLYNNGNQTCVVTPFSLERTTRRLKNAIITSAAPTKIPYPRSALRELVLDMKEEGYDVITVTIYYLINST